MLGHCCRTVPWHPAAGASYKPLSAVISAAFPPAWHALAGPQGAGLWPCIEPGGFLAQSGDTGRGE